MAGFIGVLIIVRPGLAGFSQFSLFALISVAFCALRDLATRRIPDEDPVAVHYLADDRDGDDGRRRHPGSARRLDTAVDNALGLLALAAVLLLIGYQCIIMALRSGDISAVAPFRYSALLWAMLLGYLVFGDVPDAMMVLGASIIVLSGLYAFYRERIRHRALAAECIRPCRPTGCDRHGSRHCEERSDEAIHTSRAARWIASLRSQ